MKILLPTTAVMDKEVRIYDLNDPQQYEDERIYWASKTPEERLSALESIRRTGEKLGLYKDYYNGDKQRLLPKGMPSAEEFFELLNDNKVKYLVVGGYAFAVHAEPQYTKDLDLYLEATEESAEKILHVLNKFGFSSLNFEKNDFYNPNRVVQIGYPPHRIDLLTSIEGVKFKNAWENRITAVYGGQQIYVIGKEDLIKNKRAVGRPRDILDAESLEKSKND